MVPAEALREALARAEAAEAALEVERDSRRLAEQKLADVRREALAEMAEEFRASIASVAHALGSAAEQLEASSHTLRNFAASTNKEVRSMQAVMMTIARHAQQLNAEAKALHESVATVDISWGFLARMGAEARESTVNSETTLNELSENSSDVGKVVAEIRGIAEKTKILAINARIEAARSGEAGKGFTVVANEVGSLATAVQQVTEEAAQMIENIRGGVGDTDKAMRNVTGVMQRLIDSAEAIGGEVSTQEDRTTKIKDRTEMGTHEVDKVVERCRDVANASAEALDLSSEIEQAASHLSRVVQQLEHSTEQFLARLQNAD